MQLPYACNNEQDLNYFRYKIQNVIWAVSPPKYACRSVFSLRRLGPKNKNSDVYVQAERVRVLLLDDDDDDDEEEHQENRENLTCAVCLDVYFSPHRSQPCGHVFCEPCLRAHAMNSGNDKTTCPLCRDVILYTNLQTGTFVNSLFVFRIANIFW